MSAIWFEIRVTENLDEHWSQWFEGMEIMPWLENGKRKGSIIYGCLPDQAALFGVMSQVRNLNLTLISFRRITQPVKSKGMKGK